MRKRLSLLALVLCSSSCIACGGTDDASGTGGAGTGATAGSAGAGGAGGSGTGGSGTGGSGTGGAGGSGGTGGQWVTLAEGAWSLPAGVESYSCVRKTLSEDFLVAAFRPIIPAGTHHTVVTLDPESTEPDGVSACEASTNGPQMIFGSGVGTEDFVFPAGIAVRIPAGVQILVNLHLYNTGTSALNGTSGLAAMAADPAQVEHEAESILAGKMQGLVVPSGESTTVGKCTQRVAQTVFGAFPHMHQLGTHFKVVAHPAAGGDAVLMDSAYTFDSQKYELITPIEMGVGTTFDVSCTYYNPSNRTVRFGESSDAEMCFAGLYRYPKAVEPGYYCIQ